MTDSLAQQITDMIAGKTEAWDCWIEQCSQSQLLEIVEATLAMCAEES